MELNNKFNPVLTEKPKIINTLSNFTKNENHTILNEYRTRGSESLRPIRAKNFEKSKKKPNNNETVDRRNRLMMTNIVEKLDNLNNKKLMKFQIPAHSMSPQQNKPIKFQPKALVKIGESIEQSNGSQKLEFILKGTKPRYLKTNTVNDTRPLSNIKEKQKETVMDNPSYRYCVGSGNNGSLVKRIMETRGDCWQEVPINAVFFNFKWHQNNKNYQYEKLCLNSNMKQIVNHFEFHKEISSKAGLIKNLAFYCEQNKMNLFDITPITFILDLNKEDCDTTLQSFINFYYKNMPVEMQKPENMKKQYLDIPKKKQLYYNYNNYEKRTNIYGMYGRPKMLRTYINGSNYLWLLKPNSFNRGRGIQIFRTLDELEKLIGEFCEGIDEKVFDHMEKDKDDNENKILTENKTQNDNEIKIQSENKLQAKPNKIKLNTFIIQKYLERPLLIENRKFDIRVWVLITHNYDVFFFREGYLRTSSEVFLLDHHSKNNHFIHLTNNAIQKNGKNYGQFEDGNQLSFHTFEKYLTDHKINLDFRNVVLPKIKEDIFLSLNAVKRRLNQEDRKFCFEIFGYDFIIDEDFHIWLIEVNTNPCIEESSPLLHMLIPRMLNDAFKLTIDSIFPVKESIKLKQKIPETTAFKTNTIAETPEIENKENELERKENKLERKENDEIIVTHDILMKEEQKNEEESKKTEENIRRKEDKFPINGYKDDENLWDPLGNIKLNKGGSRLNDKKS